MERFEDLIENDCFKLATLLDPSMEIKSFDTQGRVVVKECLKYHMSLLHPSQVSKSVTNSNDQSSESPKSNYIFHDEMYNNERYFFQNNNLY